MMTIAIVMVEGEAEDIDEATFCEAVSMGLQSVSGMIYCGGWSILLCNRSSQ